jgi:hypothetical protein
MESGGEPGRINISETTKALLDDIDRVNYSFEEAREIEIKALSKFYKCHFLKLDEETMENAV